VPANGQGGGMVRYVVEIAAALNRRSDVELSVVASQAAQPFFVDLLSSQQQVRALPRVPVLGRSLLERYTDRVLQGGSYDVVHGTKHLVPKRSAAARVLTVHDMLLFDRPADFGFAKRTLLRRPYRQSLAEADLLLCVSEATRARVVAQQEEVRTRTAVVPLAVSGDLLEATPQPIPALTGKTFALTVGDASFRKNLPLLVDCWDEVDAHVPGAVLAVAGPPSWAGSRHGEAFDRLVGQGKVLPLGRVPDSALRWCYENAAVALCPSLQEGFGLPAAEALAFRTPLITSTDPALCEVTGRQALHLAGDRPELWVRAIADALANGRREGPLYTARTWDEVAHETVRAVRHHAVK
jgi:glycosyltransferase involved in cell wall biosynthesis